jgi:hypothetical protein
MNTILIVWAIVAGDRHLAHRAWKPLGEFSSVAACNEAARQLGYADNDKYRCVKK